MKDADLKWISLLQIDILHFFSRAICGLKTLKGHLHSMLSGILTGQTVCITNVSTFARIL